jgi:hypothetical protein
VVLRVAALSLLLASPASAFQSSVKPLSPAVRHELKKREFWYSGCPLALSDLRVLTVSTRGFDKRTHASQLIVNKSVTRPLRRVFRKLYALHFPIHHMTIAAVYGNKHQRRADISGSFECKPPVPSPCSATAASWSMHAFGMAVDINTMENPYVGCGESHDPRSERYKDRTHHLRGMVTRRVIAAFRSIGWRWGGSWPGSTKDYTHFSPTGY